MKRAKPIRAAATSLSGGMEDYRIPGIADTPVIDVHFDEGGFDHVLGGSVGIGEVATVPTSPAIGQRHPQRHRHQADRNCRSVPTA